MATSVIGVTVQAKATGLDEINKVSGQIHQNLAGAQKAAKGLSGTKLAAVAATRKENEDYGVSRSLRPGGTGASARDFAQEAQGLGGVVRLYATYAANIFAVGAAFRALSNAMDTTNMVRGLDQLGAASGVALGTLSTRLVETTDGAISLREAMESVAKASSSGMSSENILRMGKVAKQASQALGVDMANAVDRITRGITKLEPELLDEIGIFTRVDSAVQAYAKSTGKAASSLTDFERRMAFANAVLEEGERKFSAIEIDTNPYTKLTASIKDAAQSALEFVNKGLAPIINLLSQSPTALTAILGTLGLILVKQALPAIGEFKAGLASAAESATELALKKAEDASAAKKKLADAELVRVEELAEVELAALDNADAAYKALDKSKIQGSQKVKALLKKDIQDITAQELESAEKTALARGKKEQVLKRAELDVIEGIRNVQRAEEEYTKKKIENDRTIAKEANKWGTYGQTVKAAITAQDNALKSSIVSNAAYNGSLIGLTGSMAIMKEEIAKSGLQLNAFQRTMLTARGGFAALGGMVTTFANALSGAFMWFGLITTALSILDSVFSNSSKELAGFDDSLKGVESTSKTLVDSFKLANSTNPFTTSSLEAQAKAVMELGDAVSNLGAKARTAYNSLSGWDKLKDTVKDIFGFGLVDSFQDSLSTALETAFKTLGTGAIKTNALRDINKILGTTGKSVEEVSKIVKTLDPNSEAVKKLEERLKAAGIEAGNTASKAREFSDALKTTEDSLKEIGKSFELKDPITKFASNSIIALNKLNSVLEQDIEQSIGSISTLLKSLENLPLFGKSSNAILGYAQDIKLFEKDLVNARQQIEKLVDKKKELEAKGPEQVWDNETGARTVDVEGWNKQKADIDKQISQLQNFSGSVQASATALATRIKQEIPAGMAASVGIIAKQLNAELAKGSTQLLQGLYSRIDAVPELAGRQYDLKIQELQVEQSLLEVQRQLLVATQSNALETAINSAELKKQNATKYLEGSGTTPAGREKALSEYNEAEETIRGLDKPLQILRKAFKDPAGAAKELQAALAGGNKEIGSYVQNIVTAASASAGLAAKQNNLAQQVQLLRAVEKPLAEEDARSKAEQRNLKTLADQNTEKLKGLELAYEQGQISELVLVSSREEIGILQSRNALAQTIAQAQSDYTKQLIIASELAAQDKKDDAERVRNAATATYTSQVQLAVEKDINNVASTRLKTEKDRQGIVQRELDSMQRLREIIFEIASLENNKQDAQLELDTARLERAKQVGTVSEIEYINAKKGFDITKERQSLERKMQSDALAQAKKMEDLLARYNAENDTAKKAQIKAEMDAQELLFVAKINSENSVHNLRLKNIEEAAEFEKRAKEREITGILAEAVVTGMTEGGKEGAKVLRNYLEKELKRKLTIAVEARISQSQVGRAAAVGTDLASTVMAGYSGYNLGGSLVTGLQNAGDAIFDMGGWVGDLGAGMQDLSLNLSQYTSEISAAGAYFSAFMTAMDGDYGAAIGEGLGYYFGGPIGAMIGKEIGSWLGLTDDSGTYHTGGAGSYSNTQGRMVGTSVERSLNFNLEGQNIEGAETAAADMSQLLVGIFESVAETFGLEAGYYAATAFADDTSKDGAWGALMVKLGDEILVDWKSGQDKWPGREFADGEAGQKEYLDAIAKDTIQVLRDMDLPAWATEILDKVGDAPTMETLQAVLGQIGLLNTIFETFSQNLGFSRESLESLIGPLGGVQAATQKLSFFYDNFYTDQEKVANLTAQLTTKFEDLGTALPTSVSQFKAMVLAAEEAGDSELVNNLLELAPAFKNLADASEEIGDLAEEATTKMSELAGQVGLTAESLSSIIVQGFMNGVDGPQIGKMVANTIQRGVQQALIQGVSDQITGMITAQIINPILQTIINGGVISAAVNKATMTGVVAEARRLMSELAAVFNSAEFRQLITELGNLNFDFGNLNVTPQYEYIDYAQQAEDAANKAKDDAEKARQEALKAVTEAFNTLKRSIDAQKKVYEDQIDLIEQALDKVQQDRDKAFDAVSVSFDVLSRSVDQQRSLLEDQIKILEETLETTQKSRDLAFDTVSKSFDRLTRSVNAQKTLLQEQVELAQKNIDSLDNLIKLLDTNISDLRASVFGTQQVADQGSEFITTALATAISTGVLPDSELLSDAIQKVRAGIDEGIAESKFAEDRAKLILAGQLVQLRDIGVSQKTDAELQLDALEDQIDLLDNILEQAQAQVDTLNKVDTSIIDVTAAVNQLNADIAAATELDLILVQLQTSSSVEIAALNTQIANLAVIMETAQRQVDILNGVDVSVLSVGDAVNRLNADIAAATELDNILATLQVSSAAQIAALNTQINQLNQTLEIYQAQVDAVNGVNTSVLSVEAAIAQLTAAILKVPAAGAKPPSTGGGGGGQFVVGPGGGTPTNNGLDFGGVTSSTPGGTDSFYTAGETFSSSAGVSLNSLNLPVYEATINGETYQVSNGWFSPTEYFNSNPDLQQYWEAYGGAGTGATNPTEFAEWHFATYGIAEIANGDRPKKFKLGGIFDSGIVNEPTAFNMGLMGEAGPEAIMPLTRGADGSLGVVSHGGSQAALVNEIRDLKRQQQDNERQIAMLLTKVAKSTEESRKLLDDVVRGGEAITVSSEIATY